MKKTFFTFLLLLSSSFLMAQTVIKGQDVMNGKLENGFYVLLKIDGKDLEQEWKSYLDGFGKVASSQKKHYTLSDFRERMVSNKELTVQSKLVEFKTFTKIFCVVEGTGFNENAFMQFLHDFAQKAVAREEIRLVTIDLEEAEGFLKDAQKDQKKVEKSLENNLKNQEKLGKLLDETPEKMVALLEEKKTIAEQQMQAATNEELKKQAEKKEKEILKNKKNETKYASKLQEKEAEFDELKKELFEAKKQVNFAEDLVSAKKMALKELNKN